MPRIDLHGEDRIGARILVKSFINDNYLLGNLEFAIVHGIGQGILRKEVKRVLEYGTDYFNMGCTLVRIAKKVDNNKEICYNRAHKLKGDI